MKYLIGLALMLLSIPAFSQCLIEFAGKSSIDKDPLVNVDKIVADPVIRVVNCEGYSIISFEVVTTINGGTYQAECDRGRLYNNLLDLIKKAKKGDHVIIQDVHGKSPDGKTVRLPGINLTIY